MVNTPTLTVVAEQQDIQVLQCELQKLPSSLLKTVNVQFVDLSPPDALDPASEASDRIRTHDPAIIFIGQTTRAEDILTRLRIESSPLVVRWSRNYGNDAPLYTPKTPSDAGFHLDMPKTPESFRAFVENKKLLEAARKRDGKTLRRFLPDVAKAFQRFEDWTQGKSTPALDIPITDFMYLDDDGIAKLFAQTGKQHLEAVVHKNAHTTTGKAAATLKIGKILELFGIGGADAGAHLDHARTFSEEFTEELDTIGKLKILVDALLTSRVFYFVESDHCHNLSIVGEAGFVRFTGWFHTQEDIMRVLEASEPTEQFVQFECCDTTVTLGASISKFKTGLHHVRAQLGYGEARLRIIGRLTPRDGTFYLKPYAFWQTHARGIRS